MATLGASIAVLGAVLSTSPMARRSPGFGLMCIGIAALGVVLAVFGLVEG